MALQKNYVVLFTHVVMTVIVAVVPSFSCSSSPPPLPSGLQYSVGDSLWTIPPFPDYYSNWSSSHFFKIGDSLVFDFETGRYNVIQVTRQEYESCTSWSTVKIINGGPAIIPLTERGVFYFICNFSNYCSLGQKIAITVHEYCPEAYPPAPAPTPAFPPSLAPAIITPSTPPYNNGSDQPSVPVPSSSPSPIGNGSTPEDNAPAPVKSAAITSGRKFRFYSVGSNIISGWCLGILTCAGILF